MSQSIFAPLVKANPNFLILNDNHINRGFVSINGQIGETLITVAAPYNFLLLWGQGCSFCKKFIPIFSSVVTKIINPQVKFSVYEVTPRCNLPAIIRDTIMSDVKGVPSVLLVVNGAAVKNLGSFDRAENFLKAIKSIIMQQNVQVRVLSQQDVDDLRQQQTQQQEGTERPSDAKTINMGSSDLWKNVVYSSYSNQKANSCPIDNIFGGCFTTGETMDCEGGTCNLSEMQGGKHGNNKNVGVPSEYQPSVKPRENTAGLDSSLNYNVAVPIQGGRDQGDRGRRR